MEQAPYILPSKSSIKQMEQARQIAADTTPMMAQFLEIKAINPGYLLFYRMGDFYELFFEDAEIASAALGIALTKRGKHENADIAMCGVPVRAHDSYLKKLISLGYRVAICEQMEEASEAKKRGSKSVVKRDVVRLVTAGTLTEDDLLPINSNNFLCSLAVVNNNENDFAIAWADISTGETWVSEINRLSLGDELARINPVELIISQQLLKQLDGEGIFPTTLGDNITKLDGEYFDSEKAIENLKITFSDFDALTLSRAARASLGALIIYIFEAQKTGALVLRKPNIENKDNFMLIDAATRSSLELLLTNRGEAKGSLRSNIDMCSSSAGSRLLARRMAAPLTNKNAINARLDMVEAIYNDVIFCEALRSDLRQIPDISRAITRLALGRAGPRDLLSLGRAMIGANSLGNKISQQSDLPDGLKNIANALIKLPPKLGEKLLNAIEEEPPYLAREGGFVKPFYNEELDRQRLLARESRTIISALQKSLSEETEIKSLKIKHNKVLGFFVETPSAHGDKLLQEPYKEKFIHRQTMANVMRFTTAELGELEGQIARAQDATLAIEIEIFNLLSKEILLLDNILRLGADALAKLDVTIALARLAAKNSYIRPNIDESLAFNIKDGRHPVVEETLKEAGQVFVTNDCDLSAHEESKGQLWLLTGPNMGGKSTFLRQNALIAILAQMGSFVPASFAHIGIVDRVFSRVGASDDIASGRSTFMVEMVETAAILNRASKKSLVILDEIGRGTATFDGLSIAWASVEALSQINQCRALFATHFHEMTALAKTLKNTSNHTMKVKEYKGEVVFLHEVIDGAADRSYGIAVARLAGLPEVVLNRAKDILVMLEQSSSKNAPNMIDDLPLFTHQPKIENKQDDVITQMIKDLKPDDLSPRNAVEFLYELKKAHESKKQ